jgi:surface carbohydrate biosynthesis protein
LKLNRATQEIDFFGKKTGDVVYISGFEAMDDFAPRSVNGRSVSYEKYFEADRLHLKQLSRWCARKGLTLTIAGRSNGDFRQEKVWFDQVLDADCKWTFQPKTGVLSTYKLAAQHALVTTCDSTLGYELIAAGCKVLFHSIRGTLLGERSYDFGWPSKLPARGPAWYGEVDEMEFNAFLDEIWQVSSAGYQQAMKPYIGLVMNHDSGNQELTQTLQSLLS